MIETKHLRIHGIVQGIGFRVAMYRAAVKQEITGWVRNRADGTVEAVIQGHDKDVAEFLAWVRKGPPGAKVDRVEVKLGDGIFPDFNQLPTV
ncbi:MAG: acylphosphatase [Burkholderiales bacterium]